MEKFHLTDRLFLRRILSSTMILFFSVAPTLWAGNEFLTKIESEVISLVDKARADIVTVNVLDFVDGSSIASVFVASGLVISESLVVTAANVVARADSVELSGIGYEPTPAVVVGIDSLGGIALLRTDPTLGTSSNPRATIAPQVGDWSCLVATPFEETAGYGFGIVTAVRPSGINGQVTTEIEASIQPPAASAGAILVDTSGRLMGLVVGRTQGSGLTEAYPGEIGVLAVPIHEVLTIAAQLQLHGKIVRNWIGIVVQDMTSELRSLLGVEPGRGAIILHVEEEGPAHRAQLEMGDVVLDCAGLPVHGPAELMQAVSRTPPGSTLDFTVLRDGEILEISVSLAELPHSFRPEIPAEENTLSLEIRIKTLEDEIARLKADILRR